MEKVKFIAGILSFLTALALGGASRATTITAAEYFIDDDPGEGNGIPLQAVDGAFNESTEEVEASFSTADLSVGTHTLYVRMKDSNGNWGPKRGVTFTVGTVVGKYITAAEYFIDTDPGEGNGTPLQAADGAFDEAIEEVEGTISTEGLSLGRHTLYIRMKDSEGNWGPKRSVSFRVATPEGLKGKYIVAAEYFIDDDPGEGNGIPLQAVDGAFDEPTEDVEASFNTSESPLPPGKHILYVRMKDSNGIWGPKKRIVFEMGPVAPAYIVAAEYFIDTDPGEGKGIPLQAKDGAFDGDTEQVEATFRTSGLSPGEHTLYVRMKDSRGKWGLPRSQTFTVLKAEIAKGDVNGDGEVDILDIVKVVNYITEQETLSQKEFASADVAPFGPDGQPKGDGQVNILDVVGLVDMILHPEAHGGSAKVASAKQAPSGSAILELSKVGPELLLGLKADVPVSGLQIVLRYEPEDIDPREVLTTVRSDGMKACWVADGGRLIALLYSPQGNAIASGEGPILRVLLPGEVKVLNVEEVVLSDPRADPIPVSVEVRPDRYVLLQNRPNPANMGTSIGYALPEGGRVKLEVYNTSGQLVRVLVDGEEGPGYKSVFWDGRDGEGREVSSGVYLYRLKAGKFEAVRKMVILK